eukprot:6205016-Pleurochrysis_carterae.AAC.1
MLKNSKCSEKASNDIQSAALAHHLSKTSNKRQVRDGGQKRGQAQKVPISMHIVRPDSTCSGGESSRQSFMALRAQRPQAT